MPRGKGEGNAHQWVHQAKEQDMAEQRDREAEYVRYEIRVVDAEPWMLRPVRVELGADTPNGMNTHAVYFDHAEIEDLIRALEPYRTRPQPVEEEQG